MPSDFGLRLQPSLTGSPKKLRTFGFSHCVHVSVWLRVFTDKRRTVINFVRLICDQVVRINPSNVQPFFSSVRELSVSFTRRRKWKNKRSADGAAMKDARIARRTNGRNCKMAVVSVEDGLCLLLMKCRRTKSEGTKRTDC